MTGFVEMSLRYTAYDAYKQEHLNVSSHSVSAEILMIRFTAKHVTGESQATLSDSRCFGPFVFTADKCLICPQYAACCFWPDHLLRRMSKIEETVECGVDRLALINNGFQLLKANEYIGQECCSARFLCGCMF